LGYFLKPSELFSEVARRGNGNGEKDKVKESNFIIEDIQKILRYKYSNVYNGFQEMQGKPRRCIFY